jgi:putative intracellular protease/amidase
MATTIGILLFDGAEEMDVVGPWQVFTAAARGVLDDRVLTVAERSQPVVCEVGMRVIPDTHLRKRQYSRLCSFPVEAERAAKSRTRQ